MRRRRERARARWAERAAYIRAHRITARPVHDWSAPMTAHGQNPEHCVCNGTHVHRGECPRCPLSWRFAQMMWRF